MQLSRALEDKIFDVRLRDKLVSDGKLDQKQVETYFQSLEDDSSNASYSDEEPTEQQI